MDQFRKHMKAGIILLLSSAGLVCSAATLITEGLVRFDEVATLQTFLYALFILGVCLSAGAAPVAFEFCMEQCYPVSEGILGNWLVLWFNLIHTAYFVLQQIPGIGTRWMNYVLPFANLAFLPCILSVKAKYKRSKVDNGGDHVSA